MSPEKPKAKFKQTKLKFEKTSPKSPAKGKKKGGKNPWSDDEVTII